MVTLVTARCRCHQGSRPRRSDAFLIGNGSDRVRGRASGGSVVAWPLVMRIHFASLLLLLSAATAFADPPAASGRGQALFKQYCASCHGASGKGDGALGEALRVKPADLTRISERRGGTFPKAEIVAFIDGRKDVAGHGVRDMPVWGERLVDMQSGRDADKESAAASKLRAIVMHLEAIQAK